MDGTSNETAIDKALMRELDSRRFSVFHGACADQRGIQMIHSASMALAGFRSEYSDELFPQPRGRHLSAIGAASLTKTTAPNLPPLPPAGGFSWLQPMNIVRYVVVFDAGDLDAESRFWAEIFSEHVFRDERFHSVIVSSGDWYLGVQPSREAVATFVGEQLSAESASSARE